MIKRLRNGLNNSTGIDIRVLTSNAYGNESTNIENTQQLRIAKAVKK